MPVREYFPKFQKNYAREETPIITYTKRQLTENWFDDHGALWFLWEIYDS